MIRYELNRVDSTNDWAKRNLNKLSGLTLITADTQTAGRGRFSKKWHSKPGENILATFVLFKEMDSDDWVQLLAKIIQKVLKSYDIEATLKWPNDLFVNNKKIAGILLERVPPHAVIMGFGLNVNMHCTQEIDQPVTSMFLETGKTWDREVILSKIAKEVAWRLT